MSESGGMSVNCLTAGGQNVATDVKGNITTLPVNLRPAGSTTAMNLTWDSDNKLRSADIDANGTADVNFQYDALGRRVARSGTGGSVVYVQMDQQTIADYPVGGAATTPTFRYVYASYIDEPVVRKTAGTGGTLVYFHRNQQYTITAVTTSTGTIAERYAYTAYGQPTILDASGTVLQTSNFSLRYSFTGREWDATLGLHHFRSRWMSPSAGRFLERDPSGYEGSPWGLYELLDTRPLIAYDPFGERCSLNINFTDGLGKKIKESLGEIEESFGFEADQCDVVAPVCCWSTNAKGKCKQYGFPPAKGIPEFNKNKELRWNGGGGTALQAIRDLQRNLASILSRNCDEMKKCDCLGMFVNVYCDETWNTAIGNWVRNRLLQPGQVPCNSRWLNNCENKSWEQF